MAKINNPSFFKMMFGDFSTKLRVPPAFSNNLKKQIRKFTVSLRWDLGISWKVALQLSREDGFHYFTIGWSKMVKDLQLAQGDFLVFYLVADDEFEVAVYDTTSCQKEIPHPLLTSGGRKVEKKSPIWFEVSLSSQKLKSLSLPVKFVGNARLWFQKKVVIIDPNGKKWSVVMLERNVITHVKYGLVTGWSDFIQGNGFVVGDTLRFKFVGGCKIKVEVVSIRA